MLRARRGFAQLERRPHWPPFLRMRTGHRRSQVELSHCSTSEPAAWGQATPPRRRRASVGSAAAPACFSTAYSVSLSVSLRLAAGGGGAPTQAPIQYHSTRMRYFISNRRPLGARQPSAASGTKSRHPTHRPFSQRATSAAALPRKARADSLHSAGTLLLLLSSRLAAGGRELTLQLRFQLHQLAGRTRSLD